MIVYDVHKENEASVGNNRCRLYVYRNIFVWMYDCGDNLDSKIISSALATKTKQKRTPASVYWRV